MIEPRTPRRSYGPARIALTLIAALGIFGPPEADADEVGSPQSVAIAPANPSLAGRRATAQLVATATEGR